MVFLFFRAFYRLAYTLLFRIRAWGVENVPQEGGALVVSNHQSFLDPPAVGLPLTRPVHFLARSSLFRWPGVGWLLRHKQAIPIERGTGDLAAIRTAVDLLRRGHALVLFPEGTRSRDGSVGKFQPGFAMIAARARVPIVPVAIDGSFEAWPRTRRVPRPHPVRVLYGEPMPPPEGRKAACLEAADETWRRVVALQARLRELA